MLTDKNIKRVKQIITIALLWAAAGGNLKAQNYLWAKQAGGGGGNEGYAVSTDASGNVYATGFFSGTIFYLIKYDQNGNLLWTRTANGGVGSSVCTDASGNIFVTGRFSLSTITFGSITLNNGGGNWCTYVVKYDPNGNALWARSAGGSNADIGTSVSADTSGNVYASGYFSSPTITFGSFTLTNAFAGDNDVYVVKYDSLGNVLWAKSSGGHYDDEGNSVSADHAGNVYATGYYGSANITFGTITLTNTGGGKAVYIVKYDLGGNVLWAKSAGGINQDGGNSLSTDAAGNVYATGHFSSPTITLGTFTLTNASSGTDDIYIAKYDGLGNVLWAKSAGGNNADIGYSASTDASGDVYVTGSFYSPTITFDSITTAHPVGFMDPMFIVKYDPKGNALCASALASGGDDQNGVAADAFGNAYITGDYQGATFSVGPYTLTQSGGSDEGVFVAKYTCCTTPTVTAVASDTSICQGASTMLTASGATSYMWSPGTALSCTNCANPTASSLDTTTTYTVKGSAGFNCSNTATATIGITVKECNNYSGGDCQIFVPTAFSPNNNGVNDSACVYGVCIKEMEFTIYDRWGQIVFKTTEQSKCWDGTFKNEKLNSAVFAWTLNATLYSGKQIIKKGNLTLIK